jgi:hypothetical protein
MTYLALLRGINVGGKNKVEMSRLKNRADRCPHLHQLGERDLHQPAA